MDPNDLVESITKLIDSLVEGLRNNQERMEDITKELGDKMDRLRDDISKLQTGQALDEAARKVIEDRLEKIDEAIQTTKNSFATDLARLAGNVEMALKWITVEESRRAEREVQEKKQFKEKILALAVKILPLLGVGVAGGAAGPIAIKLLAALFGA